MSRISSRINTNFDAKKNAFPYQSQAVAALRNLDYAAIFHEQGLGKTKIAIDLLLYWLQNRDIDTVLIVTKKQLVKNWQDEFASHTYIKPRTVGSDHVENFYVFNSPAKVIVTNFETVVSEKDRIKLFLKARNVAIIIDESAKLKNPDAKVTKTFFELSEYFKIRVIMTGTPVANRPYDIWSQIFFLDQGKSLGTDFVSFKNITDLKNSLSQDAVYRKEFEDAISEIFGKIASFSVRETKASSGIALPLKTFVSHPAEFEHTQSEMYNKVLKECEIELSKGGFEIADDDSVALKRLLRLNQIASNPKLIDERYENISGKEQVLDNLLHSILAEDQKCIVWSCFIENIDYFKKKYEAYNPVKIHGKMSIEDRNKSVDLFKNDETCRLLFATPQAAKEGLTLTVANHAIFYDRGFNLDDYLQAQDRIHRISQERDCFIHNIMLNGSVDEWIDLLLDAKHNAALLAQGDITKDSYSKVADYSFGEMIKEILRSGEVNYE